MKSLLLFLLLTGLPAEKIVLEPATTYRHQRALATEADAKAGKKHYASDSENLSRNADATTRSASPKVTETGNEAVLLMQQRRIRNLELSRQQYLQTRKQTQIFLLLACFISFGLLSLLIYNRKTLNDRLALKRQLLHQTRLRAQAILEAEDKERKRIGSELHDGLGQMISIAKLNLTSLQEELCFTDETHKTLLHNSLTMLDDAFREVRHISHNLGITALHNQDLPKALRHLLDTFSATNCFAVQFETVGFLHEKLPAMVEKVVYRVVQESLNNILKHAQATAISVQLIRHEKELTLLIEDNGTGFDPENLPQTSGIGLSNIRSRVEYLNGTLNIDSVLNRGTILTIEIPLTAVAQQTYEPTHEQDFTKYSAAVG